MVTFWILALITLVLLHYQYEFCINGKTPEAVCIAVVFSFITFYHIDSKLLFITLMYVFFGLWFMTFFSIFNTRQEPFVEEEDPTQFL